MNDSIVIVSAKRTPIGKFAGSLADVPAVMLGVTCVRANLLDLPSDININEVILGNVLQAGLGQNPAHQVTHHAGLAESVPSFTVNKVCGSGLETVVLGAQSILSGDNQTCIVGGMENMSAAPTCWPVRARDTVWATVS